jgi:peptide deformylase
MSVLEILTIPDKRLKHKSSEVENFDKSLEKIVKDLFDTLYSSGNGIGLAAPQVGIKKKDCSN